MVKHFLCTDSEPVVRTKQGKLRGYLYDNVYHFLGIKYADARRFQPPEPVAPWEGVKNAFQYGYVASTLNSETLRAGRPGPHLFWPASEHCQYLNVWTKSLDSMSKMPVMVWIHGGGNVFGSPFGDGVSEGDNLARFGDVVVVSINHRLNALGYLDLSSFSDRYLNSGNAGTEDLVASLNWVRENIAAFGDPGNVTIFGQSGGGGKVSALGQVPVADGLYHKTIVMSGTGTTVFLKEFRNDRELALGVLSDLNLKENEVQELETVPFVILARSLNRVIGNLLREEKPVQRWGPLVNGYYTGSPMDAGFGSHAKSLPLLVGSVIAEHGQNVNVPGKHALTPQARRELVREKFGAHADRAIELFKKAYPGKNECDLLAMDFSLRTSVLRYADRRLEESDAPVYTYLLTLEFPGNGDRPAWHCADIPFVFRTCERDPAFQIEGGETERLEDRMSGAFVSFARTGSPAHVLLSDWRPYTGENRETMIFDRTSEFRSGHDRALIDFLNGVLPAHNFHMPPRLDDEKSGKRYLY